MAAVPPVPPVEAVPAAAGFGLGGLPGLGLGGYGGLPGLGGFGLPFFPGLGKGISLDVQAGAGAGVPPPLPGLGGFPGLGFGGLPYGGFAPYIPATPLGALKGLKGDLVVPIVAVGFAIFLFVLIILAIKAAVKGKFALLDKAFMKKKMFRREAPAEHLEPENLNTLADIVLTAINTEKCTQRLLCEVGSYARTAESVPSLMRLFELFAPDDQYKESFSIIRNSAEGSFDCKANFPCGQQVMEGQQESTDSKTNATDSESLGEQEIKAEPEGEDENEVDN